MLVGIRLTLLLLELRQSVVETGVCILPIPHSLLDFLMVDHRRIPLLRVIRRLSDIIMEAANANDGSMRLTHTRPFSTSQIAQWHRHDCRRSPPAESQSSAH